MARTVSKYARVYADGYDLSGDVHTVGPLTWAYDIEPMQALSEVAKGSLPGQVNLGIGTINAYLDNTAITGFHIVMSGTGVIRNVMIPIGFGAAPAQGDPAYVMQAHQLDYQSVQGDVMSTVTATFADGPHATSGLLSDYSKPWGRLLHALAAATAVNTAIGIDDNGGASSAGGYLAYQVTSGDGTATLKVQDAATNSDGSFADLVTTGVLDFSTRQAAVVTLGVTATVRQFLRWQIVLGTATTVTFALVFVRAQ